VADERDAVGRDELADAVAVDAEGLGCALADDPVRLRVVAMVLPPIYVARERLDVGAG
jgi:hypothetical protein